MTAAFVEFVQQEDCVTERKIVLSYMYLTILLFGVMHFSREQGKE